MTDLPLALPKLDWTADPMMEEADSGLYHLAVSVYQRRDGAWSWSATLTPYETLFSAAGTSSEAAGTPRTSGARIALTREDAVERARAWVRRVYLDAAGLAHTSARDSE